MRRRAVLLGLLAASCASPEPSYFTLAPVTGTPAPGGPRTVQLRRPGLAGYLDRPEIVRGGGPYQLRVAANERWGEPLGDLIGRVMAEDLSRRLPGTTVFTEAGSITADPDARVELDIQRFDADPSGRVVLLAQASVQRGRERDDARTRTLRLAATPASGSTADLVAAMSEALGQLADAAAEMLRGGARTAAQPAPRGQSRARPRA